jgi:hypothetical protein
LNDYYNTKAGVEPAGKFNSVRAISNMKAGFPETKSPIATTKSADEMTVLPLEGLNLPVHFSHYASWHTIANYCKQSIGKRR